MTASIKFPRDVQEVVEEHCFSRTDVEVGGFLLGRVDAEGTNILHAHPALAAQSGQTNLTFTHEVWNELLPVLDSEYPGESIVGWYHSHPGFGVFLSEYDIFIQENFFSAQGQIALVMDPLEGTYGFLTAEAGIASEVESGNTFRSPLGSPGQDKVDTVAASVPGDPARRRWGWAVAVVVAGVLAAAAGWFVGSAQGQDQARQAAQGRIADLESTLVDVQAERDAAMNALAAQPTETDNDPTPTPEPSTEPAAPPAPAGPQPGDEVSVTIEHVFAGNETLWGLAETYLGSGERYVEIMSANPGLDPNNLVPGQVLLIEIRGILADSSTGGE